MPSFLCSGKAMSEAIEAMLRAVWFGDNTVACASGRTIGEYKKLQLFAHLPSLHLHALSAVKANAKVPRQWEQVAAHLHYETQEILHGLCHIPPGKPSGSDDTNAGLCSLGRLRLNAVIVPATLELADDSWEQYSTRLSQWGPWVAPCWRAMFADIAAIELEYHDSLSMLERATVDAVNARIMRGTPLITSPFDPNTQPQASGEFLCWLLEPSKPPTMTPAGRWDAKAPRMLWRDTLSTLHANPIMAQFLKNISELASQMLAVSR